MSAFCTDTHTHFHRFLIKTLSSKLKIFYLHWSKLSWRAIRCSHDVINRLWKTKYVNCRVFIPVFVGTRSVKSAKKHRSYGTFFMAHGVYLQPVAVSYSARFSRFFPWLLFFQIKTQLMVREISCVSCSMTYSTTVWVQHLVNTDDTLITLVSACTDFQFK